MQIQSLLQNKTRLPHALLLTGEPDIILQEMNPILQKLLCEAKMERACGSCPSCQLFKSEASHPDLMMITPEGKLNVIKIDMVREVIGFLEQSALRGGMRIVVFVEADTLNIASQNALLKSLEEPGAKTLIILISGKPHLLLPTIKSRCQMLSCGSTEEAENIPLAEALLSQNPLDFIEKNKELSLLECVYMQMNLLHALLNLQLGNQIPTAFQPIQQKLSEIASRLPAQKITQFYRDLAEKSALFQKKVAVNPELSLFELALAWRRLISENRK